MRKKRSAPVVITGIIIGFMMVLIVSLGLNLITGGLIYLILAKALGFEVEYWEVYWWVFLVTFVCNIVFNNKG